MRRGQRHVDREQRRERGAGVRGVAHHVEDVDPAPGAQRGVGLARQVADGVGRLLVEHPEDVDRVEVAGQLGGVVVGAEGGDAVRQTLPGDQLGRDGDDRGQVEDDAGEPSGLARAIITDHVPGPPPTSSRRRHPE